ncbi:MAG: hypothetical protein RMK92_02490 [Armatimonadota bacterium]|nr:hypothetical protein [Armatimonadota bacterium]
MKVFCLTMRMVDVSLRLAADGGIPDTHTEDVVQAIDPLPRVTSCPLPLRTHRDKPCPLHQRLDNALEQVERSFRSTTHGDLLAEAGEGGVLCEV